MALLLDIQLILFGFLAPDVILEHIRQKINEDNAPRVVSFATHFEIGLKSIAGKLTLPAGADFVATLGASKIYLIDTIGRHALRAAALPLVNRDPWDRLIVAQCLIEGHQLASADTRIGALGLTPLWRERPERRGHRPREGGVAA